MSTSIYLIDMSRAGSINGVTRCLQVLADGLCKDSTFHVTWLRFVYEGKECKSRKQMRGYTLLTIPLPNDMDVFLDNAAVRTAFWEQTYQELHDELRLAAGRLILHLHTMNLMEFALLVRRHLECRIVSHIHCLSWKGLLNNNVAGFNYLFKQYYIERNYDSRLYIRHQYEHDTYTKSDAVVCVTECAREYIANLYPHSISRLHVVPNGIYDQAHQLPIVQHTVSKQLRCLFVGSANPSKGLLSVVDAIQSAQMRTAISLTVAGNYSQSYRTQLRQLYPFVDITFAGIVSGTKLRRLYTEADIGIIASMQEQCSYVAIEMMMYGLPIIATQVDGLAEMFTHGETALLVPLCYNSKDGLYSDPLRMIEAIETLTNQTELRMKLGHNARLRYETQYNAPKMVRAMTDIYQSYSNTNY